MPTDRSQDTEAIRAASELIERLDRWATWTPPEAAGEKKLLLDTAACVARLVARLEAVGQAYAEIERWREAAISDYRDCEAESSPVEAAVYDYRASAYSRVLDLLDAALAAAAPGGTEPTP